jgi:hypothetical protein
MVNVSPSEATCYQERRQLIKQPGHPDICDLGQQPCNHSTGGKVQKSALTIDELRAYYDKTLTPVVMKSPIFWDITPCSPLKVNRRFEATCRPHLHGRRKSRARNKHMLSLWFLGLFLYPDEGDMLLRNVDWLSETYTALYPLMYSGRKVSMFQRKLLPPGKPYSSALKVKQKVIRTAVTFMPDFTASMPRRHQYSPPWEPQQSQELREHLKSWSCGNGRHVALKIRPNVSNLHCHRNTNLKSQLRNKFQSKIHSDTWIVKHNGNRSLQLLLSVTRRIGSHSQRPTSSMTVSVNVMQVRTQRHVYDCGRGLD